MEHSLILFNLVESSYKMQKIQFYIKKKVTTDTKLKRSTRLDSKLKEKKKQLACKAFVTFTHSHTHRSVSKQCNDNLIRLNQLPNTVTQISIFNQYLWSQTSKDERKQWRLEQQKEQHEHHCHDR